MSDVVTETRQHRSVSQYNQYTRCSWAYKLARIDKVWARPAAWLAHGSAVHVVAEEYEKRKFAGNPMSLEEAHTLFGEAYSDEIGKYTKDTPNFDFWSASGQYVGPVDVERRYGIGLEHVDNFIKWTDNTPSKTIWTAPDGTPGIELSFDVDLDGVLVRGFIDAVTVENGVVNVVDLKTGASVPDDEFQLAVYAVALAQQYGIEPPTRGYYWMARSGKGTYPYDLTDWPRERVVQRFHELEEAIQAERFEPVSDPAICRRCDVSLSCEFRAD